MSRRARAELSVEELKHRKLLTVREASRYSGFSRAFLDALVAYRKIDFSRDTPHRTMIFRESLDRYIDSTRTPAVEVAS